jgi:RimJ/RimL family protein N-acetyltransferase
MKVQMPEKTLSIFIKTNRLILKNMETEEITQEYVNWLNDKDFNRFLSNSDFDHTKESCCSYVKSFQNKNDRALLGMFLKDSGLHLGNITLYIYDWRRCVASIGISLGRRGYSGKGFSTEGLIALRNHSFEELGLHRLEAEVACENIRSLKLFLKSEFMIEGTLRRSTLVQGKFLNAYTLGVLNTDI